MISAEKQARQDFASFFKKHPGMSNPTDMNVIEKWDFCMSVGFSRYQQMLRFRKAKKSWTKPDPQPEKMGAFQM